MSLLERVADIISVIGTSLQLVVIVKLFRFLRSEEGRCFQFSLRDVLHRENPFGGRFINVMDSKFYRSRINIYEILHNMVIFGLRLYA